MDKELILKDFRRIPGVGKSVAEDLWNLGYRSVESLSNEEPDDMYEKLCVFQNCSVDKCMKYVFRCAVYFASHREHDPELLKWWNWKD